MITPPDDKCIMNGIMRRSILEMKDLIEKEFNLKVVERECSIHELVNSSKEGRLLEMFGAATHCPLQPISRVVFKDTTMLLNQFTSGEIGQKLGKLMHEKMRGSSSHEWITPFE
jgi:branched-subunit amino acid aminotransferase/4-amino-4-deoxychorismate lyase